MTAALATLVSSAAWAGANCENLFRNTPSSSRAQDLEILSEKVDRVLWAPSKRPFALKLDGEWSEARGYEGFRNKKSRSVIHLKRSRQNYAAHELRTALDLGRFFEKWREAEFVLVTDFNGQTVPIYDGIAIDAVTRKPLANVSLKSTIHHTHPSINQFLADVKYRIGYHTDRTYMIQSPMAWFRATTGGLFRDVDVTKVPDQKLYDFLDHPRRVADLFGLFGGRENEAAEVSSRPTWLVVDYRAFGFSYQEASRRSVLNKLPSLLWSQPDPALELFLVWNAGQVIHATRDFVNVYEFGN